MLRTPHVVTHAKQCTMAVTDLDLEIDPRGDEMSIYEKEGG